MTRKDMRVNFNSSLPSHNTGADLNITWARCDPCIDIACQRNDDFSHVRNYNWSAITQKDDKSVTVTCHDDFDCCIELHMGNAEAKELSQFIRGIMIAKGLIDVKKSRT